MTRDDPWSRPALLPLCQGCLEVPQLVLEGRELCLGESFRLFNPQPQVTSVAAGGAGKPSEPGAFLSWFGFPSCSPRRWLCRGLEVSFALQIRSAAWS